MVALVTALLLRSWHRTQERLEYCARAGAVNGHPRTMQGYSFRISNRTLGGLFFGDRYVNSIALYPGTYDDAHLAYLRDLFPEATIADYEASD